MRRIKNWIIVLCIAVIMLMLTGYSFLNGSGAQPVYEMYVNGRQVGVLRYAARGLSYYDQVIAALQQKYPAEVSIDGEVLFREIQAGKSITTENLLSQAIEEAVDIRMDAYAIMIDGEKYGYVKTIKDAESIIEAIMTPYIQISDENDSQLLEPADIKEDIEFVVENISYTQTISVAEAVALLQQGTESLVTYEIAAGDSLWSIARAHDVSLTELEEANPDLDGDKIKPGQVININGESSLLTVVTREESSLLKEIPFETEIREDSNLEKGKTKVVQAGEKGQKEITVAITRENGREVLREVLSETTLKQPVKRIEAKGTKVVIPPAPKPAAPSVNRGTARGADIVSFARQQLGKRYVYATAGPNTFDCSGFTYYVYRQFGISIPRSSRAQGGAGRAVSKSDLAPGDLVLFTSPNSGSSIGHVGIYIGGGNFIHASSGSSMAVRIDNLLSGNYARRYVAARRVL